MNIDKNTKYNYKTISKYLSNVEDYINLIHYLRGYNNNDIDDIIKEENNDKLREDMKQKLERIK